MSTLKLLFLSEESKGLEFDELLSGLTRKELNLLKFSLTTILSEPNYCFALSVFPRRNELKRLMAPLGTS